MLCGENCLLASRWNARIILTIRLPTDSNDIGKTFLRSAEIPKSEPEEKSDNNDR
jgi:hypothetical protein